MYFELKGCLKPLAQQKENAGENSPARLLLIFVRKRSLNHCIATVYTQRTKPIAHKQGKTQYRHTDGNKPN